MQWTRYNVLFAVKGVVAMAGKFLMGGPLSARVVSPTKITGRKQIMQTGISPFEAALHNGRVHEREDILTYLTSLASVTQSDLLWEAIDYIKNGKHKR